MPRVKSNVARLKRKNKVMKLAKGYFGGRSKLWKAAKESVERAQKYAYRDRRRKKGEFRRLWITRINAAARLHDLSYNRLMNGLRKAGVEINRKVLADLAVRDPGAFEQLAEVAKKALGRCATSARASTACGSVFARFPRPTSAGSRSSATRSWVARTAPSPKSSRPSRRSTRTLARASAGPRTPSSANSRRRSRRAPAPWPGRTGRWATSILPCRPARNGAAACTW